MICCGCIISILYKNQTHTKYVLLIIGFKRLNSLEEVAALLRDSNALLQESNAILEDSVQVLKGENNYLREVIVSMQESSKIASHDTESVKHISRHTTSNDNTVDDDSLDTNSAKSHYKKLLTEKS